MFDPRLEPLKPQLNQYWSGRALYQIEYAHEVSKVNHDMYDSLIEEAIAFLLQANAQEGVITKSAAQQTEARLLPLSAAAKHYQVICAAHAHIDMNWMWRWDETVAITLDTFRTMLSLMREYPAFKFSQSQASVYQIVEQYEPDMLEEIRQRVREGRWEVTASTWVEADKNLPNGESQARHLLYTRRYLSQLLDLPAEAFALDFEPDTFGHNANTPEILASGGVKYYYHCRGDNAHHLYRWQAPSGRSILVYLEPTWYLGAIEPSLALYAPAFCQKYGMDTILKVYGVGDHGGGPTRRDVERLQDMATWPVFPTLRFGTFDEYFAKVQQAADQLPVVTGELNFVFTGCYTSQSRIKRANRLAEASLNTSEFYSAFAALQGAPYPAERFAAAWQNTLFNQFHDIIPGSGVIDTREYALGLFQQTMAIASSQKRRAFHTLTDRANDAPPDPQSVSEGAGVGFGVEEFRLSQVSRGGGKQRLFHLFNPSPWPRRQVVELVVWDWDGDLPRLLVQDENGQPLRHQMLDRGWNHYWGHNYLRLLVEAQLPAGGYGSVLLTENATLLDSKTFPLDPRTEEPETLRLENEHLCATFDRQSCALISLVDKASQVELIQPGRGGVFRRILEDDRVMGTAWVVGRYMSVQNLTDRVQVLKLERNGTLRQSLTYAIPTGSSKITVTVTLDAGSRRLDVTADCEWREIGKRSEGVPQLNFYLPLNYTCRAYRYDIPCGTIERAPLALDVPANSWAAALPGEAGRPIVQLVTEGKYGFRGVEDSLALTLLRSSYDPDPYPEVGMHKIRFAIAVGQEARPRTLIAAAYDYTHEVDVFSAASKQPTRQSWLNLESEAAMLEAVKAPEAGQPGEVIIRLYETQGETSKGALHFGRQVIQAAWVDVHEQPEANPDLLTVEGQCVSFSLSPYRLAALRVKLAE